ncbi:efflux RND transporter permease subunit [Gluconobacter aidae]|uniref:efflux RND transporter permease subunit n=1 Tax=Gluconobacter aidae TaxID=2662454 RepID=UPI001885C5AF|nr:efflux RND transporter permease subunit [Gluconobacter aidae]
MRVLRHVLDVGLRHKRAVAAGTVVLLLLVCGGFTFVDQQFFPLSDRPEVMVDVAMPPGTSLDETSRAVAALERQIAGQAALRHMETHIGDSAPRFYLPYSPATPSTSHAMRLFVATDLHGREELIRAIEALPLPVEVHLHVQRFSLGPTVDFPVRTCRIVCPVQKQYGCLASV